MNREYKPSEPEPDYEGFVSGRFHVTPHDEVPSKDFDDNNFGEPNLNGVELRNSSMDPPRSLHEREESNSPEAIFKKPYLRYATLNGTPQEASKYNGDGKPASLTLDSRPKSDLGADNLGFYPNENDAFDKNSLKVHPQRRRMENGQPILKPINRPTSLLLDDGSQRSVTFNRFNSQTNESSNGSMVLQLVLPETTFRGMSRDSENSNNPKFSSVIDPPATEYYAYSPSVISFGNGNKDRNRETRSAKSPELNGRFNSSASLHSEVASSHGNYPPPSSSDEKAGMFRSFVSTVLSCIYAVILVPLGLVIYIADLFTNDASLAAAFNLYLVVIGFVYLAYLFIDIRSYVNKGKKHWKASTNYDKEDDDKSVDLNTKNITAPNHEFCFVLGRHSGSIYLKVGAAVFCFGHLIHSGLILSYEVLFFTSEEFYECFNPISLTFDIIYPVYSFFLLFFIFKYANVIINHRKELARLLIMHTIASSICFWMWAIFRESKDSVARYVNTINPDDEESSEITALISEDGEATVALPLTSYQQRESSDILEFLNGSFFQSDCLHSGFNIIYESFSPYLYPFTIEYSILIVGILYIIWNNIGNCQRGGGSSAEGEACPPLAGPAAGSNMVVHADCHRANRGLFAGILILVTSIVSIILFFIAISNPQYTDIGKKINQITELLLLISMTLTAFFAYRKIISLDVNYHSISLLDDILLFIAIPAFFLYALFSIIPAAQKHDWVKICAIIIGVIQVLIQTPLIIDGLRRCANTKKLRRKKPGREVITFLIICNVALWIIETFEIKSTDKKDYRYDFYGVVLWNILKHMTVPLIMFYRFHSSVCLADIWKSGYEPGEFGH